MLFVCGERGEGNGMEEDADVCWGQAWQNRSEENCKMMFVLVPSEPIRNPGTGEIFGLTDTSHLEED